jgi:pyrimidine operon attenuation protein/uracil phosphoribosyltransferase
MIIMARKNLAPTKQELAQFKALSDIGLTANAIGVRMKRDAKTVRKYLQSEVYNDPEIRHMVDIIKEREIDDLYLLGAKARKRLHELIDEGKTKTIETVALMDRSFQQRRLLEGQSTDNIAMINVVAADLRGYRRKKEGEKG